MRKEPISSRAFNPEKLIGQSIAVEIYEGDFKGIYSSFVYDVDDNYIYALSPTDERGVRAFIRPNQRVGVSFLDERKRRIGFDTTVIDIIKDGDNILCKLTIPDEFYRIELRENFRVDVFIETKFFRIEKGKPTEKKATILDISAGGLKISTEEELKIGEVITISFSVDNTFFNYLKAMVVRKIKAGDGTVNHYGLKFIEMDKKAEDSIIKFCLKKQMEIAKKERGIE